MLDEQARGRIAEEITERLVDLQAALKQETEERASLDELGSGEAASDPDEQSFIIATRDVDSAMAARHKAEIHALERAQARLETGDFGRCKRCGTDIPLARLLAVPASERCISCEEKAR